MFTALSFRRAASKCRFVHEIGKFCTGKSGSSLRECLEFHIFCKRDVFCVDAENSFAAFHIGAVDDDLTIESSGTHQCRVENIGAVCCGNDNHAAVLFEAVHLHQQLVERLFTFIMTAASPAPRWRPTASISSMKMMHGAFFFPCSKRSRTRLAPTPTNISTKSAPEIEKKGTPASPATARASRVFPVPGGPSNNTPARNFPPEFLKFCRLFQELDDLLQLLFRFVRPRNIQECDFGRAFVQHFCATFAEREYSFRSCALHSPHDDEPHDESNNHGRAPNRALIHVLSSRTTVNFKPSILPFLDHAAVDDGECENES